MHCRLHLSEDTSCFAKNLIDATTAQYPFMDKHRENRLLVVPLRSQTAPLRQLGRIGIQCGRVLLGAWGSGICAGSSSAVLGGFPVWALRLLAAS